MKRVVGTSECGRVQERSATVGHKISSAPIDDILPWAKFDESLELAHKIFLEQLSIARSCSADPCENVTAVALRRMLSEPLRKKLPKTKTLVNEMKEQEKSLPNKQVDAEHPGHLRPETSTCQESVQLDPLLQESKQKDYLQQDVQKLLHDLPWDTELEMDTLLMLEQTLLQECGKRKTRLHQPLQQKPLQLDVEAEPVCLDPQEQKPLSKSKSKLRRSIGKVPIGQEASKSSVKPVFCGYQLIGDSLLLRFSEQVLGEKCIYGDGVRSLGFCVSGQTSTHLLKRLRKNFAAFGDKVILLIGTNDMLQGVPMEVAKQKVSQVVQLLLGKCHVRHLVLLTLPPIPKKETVKGFWFHLTQFNDFLHNLPQETAASHSRCTVIDTTQHFLKEGLSPDLELFERWYDESRLRPDLVHLNRKGLMVLHDCLRNSGELDKE